MFWYKFLEMQLKIKNYTLYLMGKDPYISSINWLATDLKILLKYYLFIFERSLKYKLFTLFSKML
jgi:hypothetical protein